MIVSNMRRKIPKAMEYNDSRYQLAGLVERDDAFIGRRKPGPPDRGAREKPRGRLLSQADKIVQDLV